MRNGSLDGRDGGRPGSWYRLSQAALAYVTLREARRQFEPFNCSKSFQCAREKQCLPFDLDQRLCCENREDTSR
jgi:hypothetical protein